MHFKSLIFGFKNMSHSFIMDAVPMDRLPGCSLFAKSDIAEPEFNVLKFPIDPNSDPKPAEVIIKSGMHACLQHKI